ncbi:FixH family protein [Clostridium tyrobutyricum]|uniref:FixH family protein n=1 Tax=Clostridium tyrobutyricum TaxID=1519 RepID=UPI001C381BD7|nr:FixH family protein [Clostridium tyrobutyricum]MBV4416500.1 FixH family protein [Clostridium tyrobutyricum]MEA5007209.1 FixH family protein [Clostridium tyrobutyricum]
MSKKTIKNLIVTLFFTLILSTTALADSNGTKIEKNVDGIKADLILSNDTVKTGDNNLTIKLYDEKGQPLQDADVKVIADMSGDSMDNMNMDNSKTEAVAFKSVNQKGEYTGTINFSDKGNWTLKISFTSKNQEKMANFDVKVINPGPNWFIIGGFLGAVVLIIIIAGILKNKKKASAV